MTIKEPSTEKIVWKKTQQMKDGWKKQVKIVEKNKQWV